MSKEQANTMIIQKIKERRESLLENKRFISNQNNILLSLIHSIIIECTDQFINNYQNL